MEQLVVITSSYPFGTYSDFFDDEIVHLTRAFDRVVVVPLRTVGERMTTPPGVDVDMGLSGITSRSTRLRAVLTPMGLAALTRELGNRDNSRIERVRALSRIVLAAGQYTIVRRWAARQERPAIAYTYWMGPWSAALADEWEDVPVVSRVHGGDLYWERYDPPVIPMQRRAISGLDLTAAVSEHGRDYLRGRYPEMTDQIVVARLGTVGATGVAPPSTDGVVRILSVSSLTAVKRPHLLADSIIRFAADHGSPVRWTHIGAGPLESEVRGRLASAPSNLSVELRGKVDHRLVLDLISQGPWDLFINTSSSEGVPVSMMEVRSAGIPVLATDVGGTSEVTDPRFDRLVPGSAGPEAIAEAIAGAIGSSAIGREERRQGWFELFSADRNYEYFAECLSAMSRER